MDPGCLDMTRVIYDTNVHGDPAVSDFVCRSNIFLFLKAITSNFNLNVQQHWFEPEDLYLCRNIGQVFSTLSADFTTLAQSWKVSDTRRRKWIINI